MADDTPAKEELLRRISRFGEANRQQAPPDLINEIARIVDDGIDALIAAVRAEPPLTDDEQTNPETDLLERLERMTRQEQWTADVLSGRKNILGGPPKAPPCAMCHGPYQFDTTIPSRVWNSVVRAAGLPEYLCLTCIVRVFAEVGASFTATLWGGKFHGLPIEFRVNWKRAQDAALVSEENTMLRGLIQELKLAQTGAPSRQEETTDDEG